MTSRDDVSHPPIFFEIATKIKENDNFGNFLAFCIFFSLISQNLRSVRRGACPAQALECKNIIGRPGVSDRFAWAPLKTRGSHGRCWDNTQKISDWGALRALPLWSRSLPAAFGVGWDLSLVYRLRVGYCEGLDKRSSESVLSSLQSFPFSRPPSQK